MTEYSKKTVAELQEILKSRSLPHSGKKAELVKRLEDADKASESTHPAPKPAATISTGADDEIDWDEDAGAENTTVEASTEAGATLIAAGGKGQVTNPQAVPNQKVDVDPSTTDDLTVAAKPTATESTTEPATDEKPVPKTDEPKEDAQPAKDFSQGLKATDVDSELEKRKKRAAKFGTTLANDDKEEQAKLERAKRFGTATDGEAVKGLDEALPERTRKRGRNEDDNGAGGRGGKRRDFGGRGRGRRQGGGGGDGGGRGGGEREKGGAGVRPTFSDKDRLAAEARKKRFATTA